MSGDTALSAPTRFVNSQGIRFAYRRFGATGDVPLVFLQHITGTMDSWDPSVVDGFAQARPVVLVDNAGVGRSGGVTPETVRMRLVENNSPRLYPRLSCSKSSPRQNPNSRAWCGRLAARWRNNTS